MENFRQFYFVLSKYDEKLYTLCRELSWSHIRLIMRIDSPDIREYYLKEIKVSRMECATASKKYQFSLL